MMERITSPVARQSRIKGTQTLVDPRAELFADSIVDAIQQGHYDRLPGIFGKVNDADELLAVRQVLHSKGVPFDAAIPAGEPAVQKAFRTVLKQSTVEAQGRFAEALSLIELEAIGRFDQPFMG
jgi:hypothetical protein